MRSISPQHNPTPRRIPIGIVALVASVLALGVLGFIGWQWYVFTRAHPVWADTLVTIGFTAIELLAIGLVLEAALIVWRWAGMSSSIARLMEVLRIMAEKRQGARATTLHYEVNNESNTTAPDVIEGEVVPQLPPGIPSFSQLIDQGRIGPGRPLILGFDAATGEPVEGGWDALYSCGIGALQGAGKSWLAAFLLAQSAAQGGRLIVCDLHYGSAESLGTRLEALSPAFMCDIASTPDAILSALKLANDKLQQRIAGRGGSWEIIVAIDEYTSLLRTKVGAMLPDFLENVAEQGRKYHTNALLSAQGWTKDASGDVRNRLTSHYVMRQRPDEARYQLGLRATQMPLDLIGLPPATAYLLDTRGNLRKVQIPMMTSQDLVRVGAMIDRPAAAIGSPFGFQHVTAPVTASAALVTSRKQDGDISATSAAPVTTASGRATLSPEATRAAEMLIEGSSIPAIVKELRGVVPREGRRYMTALDDVTSLLKEAMKGGQ